MRRFRPRIILAQQCEKIAKERDELIRKCNSNDEEDCKENVPSSRVQTRSQTIQQLSDTRKTNERLRNQLGVLKGQLEASQLSLCDSSPPYPVTHLVVFRFCLLL